ncbi:MAG: hypothetical protein JSV10_01765 [Candidatus Zixiibacteriota bacterium]|nr:MAG: hypothetical protein JSV10_01765 [candidate division Zixibacteria bacterium]
MVRKSFVFLVVGMVMFFFASVSSADVPDSINYQGKLTTSSGGCLNDTVQMTFTIYADESGTLWEWSETQPQVEVKDGIFNVLLGSVSPLPASIFDGSAKYLGVQVESDAEMSPLKPMVSVAYAYRAGAVDCSDCDDRFVNVEGPDSVESSDHTAFLGKAFGSYAAANIGIEGRAKNSDGASYGGYFMTDSSATQTGTNSGILVSGYGVSPDATFGALVSARNYSSGGVYAGSFAANDDGTGIHYGVRAQSYGSSSASTHGSYGFASNTSTGIAYGIQGEAVNSSSGQAVGGHFYVHDSGTGSKYGVLSTAPVSNGYAGYFSGRVLITDTLIVLGGKSAAVKVDNGEYRLLYSQESPENWFEDFGEGQLVDGRTVVGLDPLFSQTVNTNITYHVFLTPGADCNGLYVVNKTPNSFEVRELKGGSSNLTFSYRIVAKRKGYENIRLAKMGGPTPEEVAAEQERFQSELEQERAKMKQENMEREAELR